MDDDNFAEFKENVVSDFESNSDNVLHKPISTDVAALIRRNNKIMQRFDKQEVIRVGFHVSNIRRDWTPAQKKCMNRALKKSYAMAGKVYIPRPELQ